MLSVINFIIIYEKQHEIIRIIIIHQAFLNHSKPRSLFSVETHLIYETVYKSL